MTGEEKETGPGKVAVGVGILATAGLAKLLEDPEPGSTGRWACLSVRGRGLARVVLASAFLAMLAGIRLALGSGFLGGLKGEVFSVAWIILGIGGTYLFIWGLVSLVIGRPFRTLSRVTRYGSILLVTPVSFFLIISLVLGPDSVFRGIPRKLAEMSSVHREYSSHLVRLHELREKCLAALNSSMCFCENQPTWDREMGVIEAMSQAHPELEEFEVLVDRPPGFAGKVALRLRYFRYFKDLCPHR
jgi:hypothetical protein